MRILIALLVVFAGCSKSSSPPGAVKRPDISTMGVQDAVFTKYAKLQLVCGADLSAPGQTASTRGPYVVWDILKHFAPEKSFLFNESLGDLHFRFEAHGKLGLVHEADYAVNGKAVHAVDVARFSGVPTLQSITQGGRVTVASENTPFTLTDGSPVTLVQSTLDAGQYGVRLTCFLQSQVKPGFEADVSTP